jgi:hypothetical protein
MAGSQALALVAQDADVQGTGMPVDPAVNIVWMGVKSPEVSSCRGAPCLSHCQPTTGGGGGGGLNHYQARAGDGLQRPLRFRFQPRLMPSVRQPFRLGSCQSCWDGLSYRHEAADCA